MSIKQDRTHDATNVFPFKKSIELDFSSNRNNLYQNENVKHRCSCDIESMNSDENSKGESLIRAHNRRSTVMDFSKKNLLGSPNNSSSYINLQNEYDCSISDCNNLIEPQTAQNPFNKQALSTAIAAKPSNYETTQTTEQNVTD